MPQASHNGADSSTVSEQHSETSQSLTPEAPATPAAQFNQVIIISDSDSDRATTSPGAEAVPGPQPVPEHEQGPVAGPVCDFAGTLPRVLLPVSETSPWRLQVIHAMIAERRSVPQAFFNALWRSCQGCGNNVVAELAHECGRHSLVEDAFEIVAHEGGVAPDTFATMFGVCAYCNFVRYTVTVADGEVEHDHACSKRIL
ncbi:hypothetical protein PsYK624_171060 [Phanerochaete sordida]|uniref:Uncharacterized protein n=1 Tax=Phanerochaete sordida TaxID=48140 RepID=A0A9P3GYW0_9APHY|nr:hypothetical protein PsYK624_171060 [Phanerochaete sordida]